MLVMDTKTQYLKSARTRYLNLCSREIDAARAFVAATERGEGGPTQCHSIINKLTLYSEKLEQVHFELLQIQQGTEESDTESFDKTNELVLDATSNAVDVVSELKSVARILDKEKSEKSAESSSTVALEKGIDALVKQLSATHQATVNTKPTVKLPNLDLPVFNGSSSAHWSEFWDAFQATIHNQKSLSDVEKYHYLKSKLTGDALNVLSGISVTAANYSVAVTTLKERFGNKQAEIDRHYISLMELPQSSIATDKLRATYDNIVKHLRSLEALGQDTKQAIFISLIMSKLPADVQVQIELQKDKRKPWKVQELLEELDKWLSATEQVRLHSKPVKTRPSLAETFSAAEPVSTRPFKPKCFFCGKEHWSDECRTYDTLEKRKEKAKGACFNCLGSTHRVKDCRSAKQCYYCKQARNHHRSLCPKRFGLPSGKPASEVGALAANCESVLMQSSRSEVLNPSNESQRTKARIFLDSGSHRTYIAKGVAKKLNLALGNTETLSVVTFGASEPRPIKSRVTAFGLKTIDGHVLKLSANVVPRISCTITRCAIDPSMYPELNSLCNMQLADELPVRGESYTPDILIGNDFYLDIVGSERRTVAPGLYLLSSKLGWILSGRVQNEAVREATQTPIMFLHHGTSVCYTTGLANATVAELPEAHSTNLDDMWKLEAIGITDCPYTSDDKLAQDKFQSTVRFEKGRYAVTWPWKTHVNLPTNYGLAYGRLRGLFTRLQSQPALLERYNAVLEDQLQKGIVEFAPFSTEGSTNRLHYIPHHPVITPGKDTTKLRIVYDASAKSSASNASLNDCLLRGPVTLKDLCGILLRFRLNRVAILADIEKAFLQVALQEPERDVTRFLWLRDPLKPPSQQNTVIMRFCRVPFGVISSPFLLAATIGHHLSRSNSKYGDQILRDIYVDNVVTGVDTVEEAKSFYRAAKSLFRGAKMNLREWSSSSLEFDNFVADSDKPNKDLVKVLGVMWNRRADELAIKEPDRSLISECTTKRQVMQAVGTLYDPVGWCAPAVLNAKLFLQTLWATDHSWDSELPADEMTRWRELSTDLHDISKLVIPRYISHSIDGDGCLLVCFCDASKLAYGTAVYLVSYHESHLLFSKSRVAPRNPLSIPRLELLAAVIGVRAVDYVSKELHIPITAKYVWTDSQCVLKWLASSKNLSTFVANRVKELRSHADLIFRYVNTFDNPADMVSRGMTTSELKNSHLWWHGPHWLLDPTDIWPNDTEQITADILRDVESEYKSKSNVLFETSLISLDFTPQPFGINHSDYSDLQRLLRVTAYCLRFTSRKQEVVGGMVYWLDKATCRWILYVQQKHYRHLNSNTIQQLGVSQDELGILRCKGRLGNADLPYDTKFPILLPPEDYFTTLVILDCHRKLFHSGVSHTLSQVRHAYWIPQGRATVKRALKTCGPCKRHDTGPYTMPPMAPLPEFRLRRSNPFTYTGLDYLGPLYVRGETADATVKVWLCLFACLSTRAVTLEVILDMSAAQFLLCLRRFISQKGKPLRIISDNAPQFKLVNRVINESWNSVTADETVISYVAKEKIEWQYIPEFSPWMGGHYERLVGMVKKCLRKSLGKVTLTLSQLQTVVKEVEAVLNTRPLTYVDDDVNNFVSLTPAHLNGMSASTGVPEMDKPEQDINYGQLSSRDALLSRWKSGQEHLNHFWRLWEQDYLLSLREAHRLKLKEARITSHLSPAVNTVVIIRDNAKVHARGSWKLGRIIELMNSADDCQRSAKVLLASGKHITRPLSMLYPLECGEDAKNDLSSTSNQITSSVHVPARPTRQAKSAAKAKMKQQSADGLV